MPVSLIVGFDHGYVTPAVLGVLYFDEYLVLVRFGTIPIPDVQFWVLPYVRTTLCLVCLTLRSRRFVIGSRIPLRIKD